MDQSSDLIDFDCPRCSVAVAEPFYGPCRACRDDLRGAQAGMPRQVEVERFEPHLHVTANAVALKEDD